MRASLPGRIDRYIFHQLALALLIVTGGLTALIWLTQSLRFVELVINHGLSASVFLSLTGLLVPSFVGVILPITTYVVVQFCYQRLAGDRELTVLRAAGLSPLRLARPGLALATIAIALGYALSLWLVPVSLAQFREFQWEIRNRVAAFLLQEGVFTPVSDEMMVYIRSRDQDGTLHGIMVDDRRSKQAEATVFAEQGRLADGPSGPRVILMDGTRQELDGKTGRLNVLSFAENTIDLSQPDHGVAARIRDMSEVGFDELLHPETHVYTPRDIPKWRAEAHRRLAGPLTAGSFAVVGLVAVLRGGFQRHGGLIRPLVSVAVVVALLASGLAIGNLAARDNALIPLIYVHAVAPLLMCLALLAGVTDRARPGIAAGGAVQPAR